MNRVSVNIYNNYITQLQKVSQKEQREKNTLKNRQSIFFDRVRTAANISPTNTRVRK